MTSTTAGRPVWTTGHAAAAALLAGLAGCAAYPPPAPPPPLLVAYPGPAKTEAEFRADDAACQASAALPAGIQPPASKSGAAKAKSQEFEGSRSIGASDAPPSVVLTPGMTYLRCMVARSNVVQPAIAASPVAYTYYAPYPVYGGYADYSPWLYDGSFGYGFGYYGGFRHGYGFHEGYGYRGGYRRGGEAFRSGGFRGGEGFRNGSEGGGFRGGGRR